MTNSILLKAWANTGNLKQVEAFMEADLELSTGALSAAAAAFARKGDVKA